MTSEEKNTVVMAETPDGSEVSRVEDVHTIKKVHADGTVDLIDAHAIGGNVDEMPKGYYYSPQFIGTVIVS